MSELLKIAFSQLGVKEVEGASHNQTIVDYAKDSGFEWINDDETPWCSVFANWCALISNVERTHKANARSWIEIGTKTDNPKPGDVAIFKRGNSTWQGHVAFFLGFNAKGDVFVIGGNQGNQVSVATYPKSKLLGFRNIQHQSKTSKVLKLGDRGAEVKKLQSLLSKLGIDVGAIDGIFGEITREGLMLFQRHHELTPDGFYGPQTKTSLETEAG